MKEGAIKDAIKKVLRRFFPDVWYFMPIGGPYSSKGIPDFIVCAWGRFIAIEAKAPGKKPTLLQAACHEAICRAGGLCLVVDSLDDVAQIRDIMQMLSDEDKKRTL